MKETKSINFNVPILFDEKNECCGCSVCCAICPKNAIKMQYDEEGFLYPVIDENLCVFCKLCLTVCTFKR